ncbi:MAG TPA: hypothetical protein VFG52_08795 [Xanthomonadales bacterium]|nr:hypothetical protein [Xanthomonadales bacterium]
MLKSKLDPAVAVSAIAGLDAGLVSGWVQAVSSAASASAIDKKGNGFLFTIMGYFSCLIRKD